MLEGWGVRDNNWDLSTEVQHELTRGSRVTAGYYYNTGGYTRQRDSPKRVTDNLLVVPADYDPYCITAPDGSGCPAAAATRCAASYDVKPEKFGKVANLVTAASSSATSRAATTSSASRSTRALPRHPDGRGLRHRRRSRHCFVVDAPGSAELPRCHAVERADAGEVERRVPLPVHFVAASRSRTSPGRPSTRPAGADGRDPPSSAGPCPAAHDGQGKSLLAPQTLFEGRVRRLDLRLTKNHSISSGCVSRPTSTPTTR